MVPCFPAEEWLDGMQSGSHGHLALPPGRHECFDVTRQGMIEAPSI